MFDWYYIYILFHFYSSYYIHEWIMESLIPGTLILASLYGRLNRSQSLMYLSLAKHDMYTNLFVLIMTLVLDGINSNKVQLFYVDTISRRISAML